MNIHPVGAIFWIAVAVWIVWKIKQHLDNQALAKRLHEEAKREYAALSQSEKQKADQRAEKSIKLPADSEAESESATAKVIVLVMLGILVSIIIAKCG